VLNDLIVELNIRRTLVIWFVGNPETGRSGYNYRGSWRSGCVSVMCKIVLTPAISEASWKQTLMIVDEDYRTRRLSPTFCGVLDLYCRPVPAVLEKRCCP
jgi:hypothetical protein